jgi:hypothetical protein
LNGIHNVTSAIHQSLVFGRVVGGESLDVLDTFAKMPVGKNERPLREVKIYAVEVLVDPWAGAALPTGAALPEVRPDEVLAFDVHLAPVRHVKHSVSRSISAAASATTSKQPPRLRHDNNRTWNPCLLS